jgi:hypothetical protein
MPVFFFLSFVAVDEFSYFIFICREKNEKSNFNDYEKEKKIRQSFFHRINSTTIRTMDKTEQAKVSNWLDLLLIHSMSVLRRY